MPPKTSPTQHVTELMGRRSLATIPKDQKSLLEAEGSWAVDMEDGPHGLSTVPGHVLQTLKEAFVRLKDQNNQAVQEGEEDQEDQDQEDQDPKDQEADKEDNEDPKQTEEAKLPLAVNNGDKQNASSPGPTASNKARVSSPERPVDSSPVDSSPERSISWAATPSRVRDHPEASNPGSPIDEEYNSPLLAPLSQPLPPPADDAADPGPSSGISEPDDLEMEIPQAQANHEAPINRVATLMHTATPQEPTSNLINTASTTDTPPCAQPRVSSGPHIPIPTAQLSLLSTDPTHHRTRRMKPILFDEDGPNASGTPPIRLPPLARMPSTRAPPDPSSIPLSSAASTPFDDDMMEGLPPMPPPHRFIKDATRLNRAPGRQDEMNRLPHSDAEASHTPIGHLYKIQAAVDVVISKSGDPYVAFTTTYPDYATVHSGNLLSFIEACCHLNELQGKRLIREYLFDDFIRAWSGYLKYALREGPSHLPAIEWFNDLRGPILFNRMCVRGNNLDTVLGAYPEEVARIQAAMNQSRQKRPADELGMEMEQDVEFINAVDDDSVMADDDALEATRDERKSVSRAQKRPRAASAGDMAPPTRQPPIVPAPSRTAPAPPPPRPPIPRAASPDVESDDFDYLPYPAKRASNPKPRPQPAEAHSRSRSRTQQAQPELESIPQPQPQPPLQPKVHRSLPQRESPRRHPTTSAVIASPTRRQPPKSSNPRSSPRPTADYLGNFVSKSRTAPSSSARSGSSKPRKRTAEERARLREHFRKKASSSMTSLIGSGIGS
ncbi:hypothetical protein ACQKWADRAFT_279829 [Trichoderma austrokoningii]